VAFWLAAAYKAKGRGEGRSFRRSRSYKSGVRNLIKRLAVWAFYAVGALAIAYLALYAYAMFSGHPIVPGDPIRIFRSPDAPSYS